MAKEWSDASDSVGTIAGGLIPNYHPELGTARIGYIFVSEASTKGGQKLLGRVKKYSGYLLYALEREFDIEVPLDEWNGMQQHQRTALVDHLLERITGEEDDKTGEMKWRTRDPDVQEFSTILDRHGAWHNQLAGFVSVAKRVSLEGFTEEDLNATEDEQVATTEDEEPSDS